jgi:hypothetical protein
MSEEQLQTVAYLYGRSREKLKHTGADVAIYESYVALNQWLWRSLQENSAMYHGRLKRKYIAAMEAGSKSLEAKSYKVHSHRVFEVEHHPRLRGSS